MKRVNSGINPDDLVDRMSALPDSILSLILSFIPTKNAVATSVLSKRWISLWKAVINLDFKLDFCIEHCMKKRHQDCSKGWSADEDLKFASFVNHVLLLHDSGFLNKFRLVWKPMCIPSQVYSWISTAITKTVHKLFLCLENSDVPIEIPSSVFTCATLQSLELNGNVLLSDETVVFLPKLRCLKLVSVYFQSEQALQTLISGCPMLNCLDIEMEIDEMMEYYQSDPDTGVNVFTFRISSTSVTILKLSVKSDSYADHQYNEIPHCSLELKTSSLEFLKLVGHVSRIFVQETLSSLVGADLDIEMSNFDFSEASVSNSLVKAVRALNFAVGLTLSRYALWALSHATISLSTKFKRLIKLEVVADCCICNSLQDFIQSSDNLEILVIIKASLCENDDDHLNLNHLNWATPAEVPTCLSNKLEAVIFYHYSGFSYEHEMIGYMLEHGRALKAIAVYCEMGKSDIKYELLQDISEFPRKSPACKVHFSEYDSIPPLSLENFPEFLLM